MCTLCELISLTERYLSLDGSYQFIKSNLQCMIVHPVHVSDFYFFLYSVYDLH